MKRRASFYFLAGFTGLIYLFLFGPLIITVLFSFSDSRFPTLPITGLSLQWFRALYENSGVLRALLISLEIGALAAITALVLGVPAALAIARYEFRGKSAVRLLFLFPVLIPEIIIAVGLLLLMKALGQSRSLVMLFLGHVVLSVPFVVLVAQVRLAGLLPVYEEAARSLGATRFAAFREITLPLMMPAILSGGTLAFVISFDNITATLLWRPGGIETVPTLVYGMLRDSISPEINALGTVIIALTLGVPLLATLIVRKVRARPFGT